jgi:hypothetical protein
LCIWSLHVVTQQKVKPVEIFLPKQVQVIRDHDYKKDIMAKTKGQIKV